MWENRKAATVGPSAGDSQQFLHSWDVCTFGLLIREHTDRGWGLSQWKSYPASPSNLIFQQLLFPFQLFLPHTNDKMDGACFLVPDSVSKQESPRGCAKTSHGLSIECERIEWLPMVCWSKKHMNGCGTCATAPCPPHTHTRTNIHHRLKK